MQAAIDVTVPPVRARHVLYACVNSRGQADDLLVFDVPPSTLVHATARDDVFLRMGDESRRLTYTQRRELIYDKGHAVFEAESSGLPVTEADDVLLRDYARRTGHPDARRLLQARGLSDGAALTIAGCLLFARNPQQMFPNAHIRVSRYSGSHRGPGAGQQLSDDIRTEEPILNGLTAARKQVLKWQPRRRHSPAGGERGSRATHGSHGYAPICSLVIRRIAVGRATPRGRFPGLAGLDNPLQVTGLSISIRSSKMSAWMCISIASRVLNAPASRRRDARLVEWVGESPKDPMPAGN